MSYYMWGLIFGKPTRAKARMMNRICREEGGYGLNEVNLREGASPGINNGRYQGWFSGPNRGNPYDEQLATRVAERIKEELNSLRTPDLCQAAVTQPPEALQYVPAPLRSGLSAPAPAGEPELLQDLPAPAP